MPPHTPSSGPGSPTTARSADGTLALEDFYAFAPTHSYVYLPCREFWVAESINSILPSQVEYGANGQPLKVNGKIIKIKASTWLDRFRRVEQVTWAPELPDIIRDKHVVNGGWFDRPGGKVLNLYRPPRVDPGDAGLAGPWIKHLNFLYRPDDVTHIVRWLAHRVQHPGQKINHSLMMGGAQGIGKDLILVPVRYAVGTWNFSDITPANLFNSFNPFVRSVILRVNEAHDLGEGDRPINRFSLYERLKIYTAAPPEVLRCNEKNIRQYYVFNVLGLLITTNHKSDGIYLPSDDRRHYAAWSTRVKEEITDEYRNQLWHWLNHESGNEHVAAYLSAYDLSGFDPYAPPPKTAAFYDIVEAGIAPENTELADAIEQLPKDRRDAVTLGDIVTIAPGLDWLLERKSRRAMPHRFEQCGYVPCHNPDSTTDGRWRFSGKNQKIYVNARLTPQQQIEAAKNRAGRG